MAGVMMDQLVPVPTKHEAALLFMRLLKLYRKKCDGHLTFDERKQLSEAEVMLIFYFKED